MYDMYLDIKATYYYTQMNKACHFLYFSYMTYEFLPNSTPIYLAS